MLKLTVTLISFLLIAIIFLRIPEENVGLSSLTTKNVLGSPRSSRQFLNILTGIGILL